MDTHSHVFVLYDGIKNSVFQGQVLTPLISYAKRYPDKQIQIISFERSRMSPDYLKPYLPAGVSEQITLTTLYQVPFIGTLSLWFATLQLRHVLRAHKNSYELTARGPLAGWICMRAITALCTSFTIQARGLLAEEYAYTQAQKSHSFTARAFHKLRARQFKSIERAVYSKARHTIFVKRKIEVVSKALGQYLIKQFEASPRAIVLSHNDIPAQINSEQKKAWREAVREKYAIPSTTRVICYNGSAKPWQSPERAISYFVRQHKQNADTFFLILSQDVKQFKKLLEHKKIPQSSYYVTSVPHHDIYQYLSACDVGVIFRSKHIINWVSRPTKALEYHAVGLKIVHNNTIDFLNRLEKQDLVRSVKINSQSLQQ